MLLTKIYLYQYTANVLDRQQNQINSWGESNNNQVQLLCKKSNFEQWYWNSSRMSICGICNGHLHKQTHYSSSWKKRNCSNCSFWIIVFYNTLALRLVSSFLELIHNYGSSIYTIYCVVVLSVPAVAQWPSWPSQSRRRQHGARGTGGVTNQQEAG